MSTKQLLTLAECIKTKDLDADTWIDLFRPTEASEELVCGFESHDWTTRIFLFFTRGDIEKDRNRDTINTLQGTLYEALGESEASEELLRQFTHLENLKTRGSTLTVRRFQIIMRALCQHSEEFRPPEIGNKAPVKEYHLLGIRDESPATSLLSEHIRAYGLDLSTFNFQQFLLTGVALRGCNLQGVDFSNLDLRGVDFSGANLQGAIFTGAQLEGAKFIGAQLEDANFSNSGILNEVNFSGADLKSTKFTTTELGKVKFIGAKLTDVDFSDSGTLNEVNFSGADLKSTKFTTARLGKIKFIGAKLTDVDFSDNVLGDADFSHAELFRVNFSNASVFHGVTFAKASLREVNFVETFFGQVDFQGTQLADLVFNTSSFRSVNFGLTIMGPNTQITFSEATIAEMLQNSRNRDLTFNYFHNRHTPFFTLLNSISSPAVRLKILEQIARAIYLHRDDQNIIQELYAPFLDTLTELPIYTAPNRYDNWRCCWLLEQTFLYFLENLQSEFFVKLSPSKIKFLLPWIEEKIQTDNTFLEKYNSGIQLLLGQCMLLENEPNVCQKAGALKRGILRKDFLAALRTTYQADNAATEEECLSSLFFLSQEGNSAVVIEKDYARYYIYSDPTAEHRAPTAFWSYQKMGENYQAELPKNPHEVLNPWPLLIDRIGSKLSQGKVLTVLSLIFSQDPAMHVRFKAALSSVSLGDDKKLTTTEHKQQFQKIFDPFYFPSEEEQERILTPEHKAKLFEILELQEASPETRSLSLVSLAAFFIKSSSSAIFGTETDSPTALRVYGSALLDLAREENNGSIPHLSEDQFIDWQNRLRGREGAFTCTSVLFNMVNDFLKALPGEERKVLELLPSVWH